MRLPIASACGKDDADRLAQRLAQVDACSHAVAVFRGRWVARRVLVSTLVELAMYEVPQVVGSLGEKVFSNKGTCGRALVPKTSFVEEFIRGQDRHASDIQGVVEILKQSEVYRQGRFTKLGLETALCARNLAAPSVCDKIFIDKKKGRGAEYAKYTDHAQEQSRLLTLNLRLGQLSVDRVVTCKQQHKARDQKDRRVALF